jgi:hypothetical protein
MMDTPGVERGAAASKHEKRAARQRRSDTPPIAFVHSPNTAGGTVTAMLAAAYSAPAIHRAGNYLGWADKASRKVERWNRRGGQVAVGHVPYSVFQAADLPAGTQYMTFLRDPVERVLSHYYGHVDRARLSHNPKPPNPELGGTRADSLEQALEEKRLPLLRNLATRFLCGDPDPWAELSPLALSDARVNLRRFAFIGIQERFEESMERLQAMLALDVPRESYKDRHVSTDRPAAEDIPADQRALILEHNKLDVALYEFALDLFDSRPPR